MVDTFTVDVTSDKKALSLEAQLRHFYSSPFEVPNTLLTGSVSHDTIQWDFASGSNGDTALYHLSGFMQSRNQAVYVGFDSTRLILNARPFSIPPGNYLKIDKSGFTTHDLRFTSGKQELAVLAGNSSRKDSSLVRIRFTHFNINNLVALVSGNKEIISAITDGTFSLTPSSTFSSDLTLTDISLFGDKVFQTARLQADNKQKDVIRLSAGFEGEKDRMKINGTVNTGGNNTTLDLTADIGSLNLASYQPFFPQQVSDLGGTLSGKLSVTGKVSNPEISGYLAFSDVSVTPVFTGSQVQFQNDRIVFDKHQITLNAFTLKDADGNTATLNGSIDATDLANPTFDLSMNTPGFQLLNTSSESRNMVYGQLIAGFRAQLKGDLKKPEVLPRRQS